MCVNGCCRRHRGRCRTAILIFFLISAVPVALITSLERSTSGFRFRSHGWIRECSKWDPEGRRFLVSTFTAGGVAEIPVDEALNVGAVALEERPVVNDADVAGNTSVGIVVDQQRRRLLVVYIDLLGKIFSAVGAYDLASWDRLFLTCLSGPGDGVSSANDVAVDEDGNAYVTDSKENIIWKVGLNGELLSIIRSKVFFQRKEWYYNFVGLNGIVYHPNGYLLVVHTASGHLFKVNTANEEVSVVKVEGSLIMGDGMELLSPTKLVVAGTPSGRIVESFDDWETAKVTERYVGPIHRIATAATVKDGKVYLNHLIGAGINGRTHLIAEAVFLPLNAK